AVAVIERVFGLADRTQQFLERWSEQIAKLRRAALPLIRDLLLVMTKIRQIKLVGPVWLEPHNFAHRIHERGLAIGCEPHNFVLVAIVREAQILRQRLIEDAQRMRKISPPVDRNVLALPDSPRSASKVPKSVD